MGARRLCFCCKEAWELHAEAGGSGWRFSLICFYIDLLFVYLDVCLYDVTQGGYVCRSIYV